MPFPAFGNLNPMRSTNVLRSFDNFARLNAAGADLHPAITAVGQLNTDRLKIGIETPPRLVVRVRNIVSKLRPFPAYVATLCHN